MWRACEGSAPMTESSGTEGVPVATKGDASPPQLRSAWAGPNSNSWERQGSSGSAPTPEGVRRPRVDPKLAAAHAAWLA